jgi:hypothetical protein
MMQAMCIISPDIGRQPKSQALFLAANSLSCLDASSREWMKMPETLSSCILWIPA